MAKQANDMFVLGHIGYGWSVGLLAGRRWTAAGVSLPLLALAALVPDLVDKPLAILLLRDPPTSRLWTHSLTIQTLVVAAVWAWRRALMPYALMLPLHVVLDAAEFWTPSSFFWPLLGWDFVPTEAQGHLGDPLSFLGFVLGKLLASPLGLAYEVGGLAIIAFVLGRRLRPAG